MLEHRDAIDEASAYHRMHFADRAAIPKSAEEFVRVISEAVRVNEQQPEISRLYTVLSAEALAEDHPAHAYFQRRFTTT